MSPGGTRRFGSFSDGILTIGVGPNAVVSDDVVSTHLREGFGVIPPIQRFNPSLKSGRRKIGGMRARSAAPTQCRSGHSGREFVFDKLRS